MIKSKKQMFLVIISFILVLVLGTVSYAFFNYTRTGSTNTVSVGRLNFTSTQNNTINLSNVFPTDSDHLDASNSGTVTINITGDTNYSEGIEYKVSIVDVNNVVNHKEVPIGFTTTATNLGTKSNDYYNDRGSTTNVYNLIESGSAINDELILVGYIKPDENGINGSINITAYIDKDKVAISDTVSTISNGSLIYEETGGDWLLGREVFTTTEWNSLAIDGISFKIKVEANEGIWVEEPKIFVLKNLAEFQNWDDIRESVTSIEFSTNSEVPSNAITYFDVTDITSSGPVTLYTLDDGLGNNTYKVVICADDVIYAPPISTNMFSRTSNLVNFNSENFKVDNVVYITGFFTLCRKLENVYGLSEWNVSNVRFFSLMFATTAIHNTNFALNWDTSKVEYMNQMFHQCPNITDLNGLINWNTTSLTNLSGSFRGCTSLTNVDGLANWDISKVTTMSNLFRDCSGLVDISAIENWDVSSVTAMDSLFFNGPIITSYQIFKNWDVSKVETFFKTFNLTSSSNVTSLSGLENWDVSSATEMEGMFKNNIALTDASAINNWNINPNSNFTQMFGNTPVHPEFTRVQGTWGESGTFTPTT